jgi:Domain of unknown function (DUF4129)
MSLRLLPLLALLLPLSASADDAPLIKIRSRARLEVGTVERSPHGVTVSGALWDDAANAGVDGKRVRVLLRGTGALAADSLRVELPAPMGSYEVEAAFLGDGDYAPPPPIARTVDVRRRPVELTLSAPDRSSITAKSLPFSIEVRDAGRAADLPLEISLDPLPDRPGVPPPHLALASGAGGRTTAALDLPPAAPAGARLILHARFAGDAERDAASAERAVLLTAPTRLDAEASAAAVPRGDDLAVAGRLTDPNGPLEGQVVEAVDDAGRTLGQALTDRDGRFTIAAATRALPAGAVRLHAAYDPPVSFRDAARSPSLEVTILPPAPVPLAGWLTPPLATLALLAGVWVWRKRPFRLLARPRVRPADPAFASSPAAPTGLVEARPRLSAQLRRPHDLGVDGVAWDAPFDRPVAAQVMVQIATVTGDQRAASACDERGRFSFDRLPAGRARFTVVAAGYLAERFERELPHRGELRGVRVHLRPIRAEILSVYKQIALGWLPAPNLFDTWTPRQLLDHVRAEGGLPPPLAALTDLVEESYYSPRISDEEHLTEALRLANVLEPNRAP